MPKYFTPKEKIRVTELYESHKHKQTEILEIMRQEFPGRWDSKGAYKSIARLLGKGPQRGKREAPKTLDQMTRDERFRYIEKRLVTTARFRLAFKNFDDTQKTLFTEEYLGVLKSTESLTEVEEQLLFAAILELVLAFQCLSRKEREESFFEKSMNGEIPMTEPQFRNNVDDRYQKEYDAHMKLYQKGIESLKMSRQQRLQDIRSQKQSLIDVAQELSSRNAQSEVADEIAILSKLKDEELAKLIENGHLLGSFQDFT